MPQPEPYQQPLFHYRPVAKVVPIQAPATPPAKVRQATAARPVPGSGRARLGASSRQGQLDLQGGGQNLPKTLRTSADAQIYCNDPVAKPLHRAVAACVDLSLLAVADIVFVSMILLAGVGWQTLWHYRLWVASGILLVGVFYRLYWALAMTETPGMRWTGLRLVHFGGGRPTFSQHAVRFLASLLSLAAGGLGLLWIVLDEEHLGWHDSISSTFPTVVEGEPTTFHRE